MKSKLRRRRLPLRAFSLVEVVLALGVVSFAIVAILGILPVGLNTGHSAQDETRAAHIAQAISASLASQAQTQFNNVQLKPNDNSIPPLDLSSTSTNTTKIYADNDGNLSASSAGATYAVTLTTNGSPGGLDAGYANQVTISIAWPASAPAASQTKRDFVQTISKY